MNQKLYAFWRYDRFPFVLGAEVSRIDDDGCVRCDPHYFGMRFRPLKILPLEEGVKLKVKLDELANEEHKAQLKLEEEFKKKLKVIFPEAAS